MAYNEFAYFYDEFNGEADYDALYAHIHAKLKEHGIHDGILADLGCGTGELTLMLTQAGYDMIGIDQSEEMLCVVRDKAEQLGLSGRLLLLRQDLLKLDLYGTIRGAVSTFDTFNHIPDLDTAIANAGFFMEKGGVFLFDMNTPYKHRNVLGDNAFTFEEEDAACVWRNHYDAANRRVEITVDIDYHETGEHFHEQFCEYTYDLDTIRTALEKHGFALESVCDGETFGPLTEDSQRYFFCAVKQYTQLEDNFMANLIRGLSENGGVVFCGVDSTQIVRKAEKLHTTSATCSAALGRLLTGAALMGSMIKDDRDQITLRVSGGGPAGVVIACTDGTVNVKGCIDHPLVELPAKPNGHLDVGGAVGKDGVLTVIRDNRLQKEPTVGQVPLVSGEIAEDLTAYYAYSEQVPTVMALGVLVDKDLSILCAGGFMVQLLPGATDAEIDQLEKNIAAMPSVTTLLHEGKTPEDMMQLALAGFAPNVLDERDVHYQCDCSAERTKEMLFSLGRKELVRMRDEDPACEVVCHFCHSKYQYDLNDLLAEYDAQAAERAAAEQGT